MLPVFWPSSTGGEHLGCCFTLSQNIFPITNRIMTGECTCADMGTLCKKMCSLIQYEPQRIQFQSEFLASTMFHDDNFVRESNAWLVNVFLGGSHYIAVFNAYFEALFVKSLLILHNYVVAYLV